MSIVSRSRGKFFNKFSPERQHSIFWEIFYYHWTCRYQSIQTPSLICPVSISSWQTWVHLNLAEIFSCWWWLWWSYNMPWSLWSCKSNINIENINELIHWWIFWKKIELFPFPLKKFSWFFIKILGIVEKNFKKMQIDF